MQVISVRIMFPAVSVCSSLKSKNINLLQRKTISAPPPPCTHSSFVCWKWKVSLSTLKGKYVRLFFFPVQKQEDSLQKLSHVYSLFNQTLPPKGKHSRFQQLHCSDSKNFVFLQNYSYEKIMLQLQTRGRNRDHTDVHYSLIALFLFEGAHSHFGVSLEDYVHTLRFNSPPPLYRHTSHFPVHQSCFFFSWNILKSDKTQPKT